MLTFILCLFSISVTVCSFEAQHSIITVTCQVVLSKIFSQHTPQRWNMSGEKETEAQLRARPNLSGLHNSIQIPNNMYGTNSQHKLRAKQFVSVLLGELGEIVREQLGTQDRRFSLEGSTITRVPTHLDTCLVISCWKSPDFHILPTPIFVHGLDKIQTSLSIM